MPFLAPAFGAVAAFAGTAIGQIVIGVAGSLAVSLLQSLLTPEPKPTGPAIGGVQLEVQLGDTAPLSFPAGYSATAGARKYQNSWGQSGDVPNAFLVEVRQLADIPISGLNGIWVNNQKCTILWGETPTAMGYPVAEFRVAGKDHLWVKFHDGTQTVADTYLVSKFGALTEYAWKNTAIGTGCPYAIVTALWDRDVWAGSSRLDLLFEPGSALFYDFRKDSTNGGSGSHRWNNPLTWEPSDNPAVILYNLIRGVYYGDEWIFGGRDIHAFQLPSASWIAAANECDVLMPLDTAPITYEKQFRCGFEVICDKEPLQVIEELLQICNGRLCEIGGIFEIMVGPPGAAIYSFTDDDIVITRDQKFTPSPGLNDTRNAIEYTYPEPVEAWTPKNGPSRFYPEFEAQDGERRLARGINFNASPFNTQNQRLANTLVLDDRRWRTHEFTLPPDAWILTGTSVVNWTSARNGYINKKFVVYRAVGEPGMCQPVVLREVDPDDWDWNTVWQLPNPTTVLTPIRPGPQIPTGFQALPAVFKDASGQDRRPSIQIIYDGNMPDIQSVHVIVRLKATDAVVYEQFLPFEPPYSVILNGVFLPNELYTAAIRYVPVSARPTGFTEPQDVLTPDIKFVPGKDFDPYDGAVGFDSLEDDLAGYLAFMGPGLRSVVENAQALALRVAEQDLGQQVQLAKVREEAATSYGLLTADYQFQITVLAQETDDGFQAVSQRIEALEVTLEDTVATAIDLITVEINNLDGRVTANANAITALDVTVGRFSASGRLRVNVAATETGALSTIGLSTSATDGGATSDASLFLSSLAGGLSRVTIIADQFVVSSPAGPQNPLVYDGTALRLNVANIGTVNAGIIQGLNTLINLNTGFFSFG